MNKPVYPKFVVLNDGQETIIVAGMCTYHRELFNEKHFNCIGGGWFKWDRQAGIFQMYSNSDQFGYADIRIVEDCIAEGKVYTSSRKHRKLDLSQMSRITFTSALVPDLNYTNLDIPEVLAYTTN
ncbi:hypothetical protein MA9V2_156 [Chryseobacterium phage MA9V-2]|nr:hypothetical protein MA9V2_156 [Chryseobacterium phage MA9V-2]